MWIYCLVGCSETEVGDNKKGKGRNVLYTRKTKIYRPLERAPSQGLRLRRARTIEIPLTIRTTQARRAYDALTSNYKIMEPRRTQKKIHRIVR